MRIRTFAAASLATVALSAIAYTQDGPSFDSNRLQPYGATWRQLTDGEDGLALRACISETLFRDLSGDWVHVQTGRSVQSGQLRQEIRTLSAADMRTTHLYRAPLQTPQDNITWQRLELTPQSAEGVFGNLDGSTQSFERLYEQPVRDGWILGLIIASLPLENNMIVRDRVAIPVLDQRYDVEIRADGPHLWETDSGESIPVWEVGVAWTNLDDDDLYAAGPNRPGGTYYIAVDPAPYAPHVVGYRNETVSIEWGQCS
jgi:hypothetical protein